MMNKLIEPIKFSVLLFNTFKGDNFGSLYRNLEYRMQANVNCNLGKYNLEEEFSHITLFDIRFNQLSYTIKELIKNK